MINKKAFSLLEVVIATMIISVGIISLLLTLNKFSSYNQISKNSAIANMINKNNLEKVIFIINQNKKLYSGQISQCRAKINPYDTSQGDYRNCNDDQRIQSGYYILSGNEHYFLQESEKIDLQNNISTKFCVNFSGNSFTGCKTFNNNSFFTQIQSFGIYEKNTNQGEILLDCQNGISLDQYGNICGDTRIKELFICSKTYFLLQPKQPQTICVGIFSE